MFDPTGQVIGVVTLKTVKQESIAFCIPPEALQAALKKVQSQTEVAANATAAKHRTALAFKVLCSAGAVYSIGLELHRLFANRNQPVLQSGDKAFTIADFDKAVAELDSRVFLTRHASGREVGPRLSARQSNPHQSCRACFQLRRDENAFRPDLDRRQHIANPGRELTSKNI